MKRRIINLFVITIGTLMLSSCSYNSIISLDEGVKKAWAVVEAQYQRRSDLIGNLVETVKGEAKFERETLQAVVDARSKATSIQINADDITPENMAKFQQAQATQAFQDLMNQLEGTENRVTIARQKYNDAVQSYNIKIRSFPSNVTAGIFSFKQKEMFKADTGTEKAPKFKFD